MRRAIARRAQLSTQEQKEHNLATMLLVVVLVFFICNLLPLVVNIVEMIGEYFTELNQVSNFLVTCNSSVNILIYCTFGKKFRTVFMQIFFGKQPPCMLSSRSVHGTQVQGVHNHHIHSTSEIKSDAVNLETMPLTGMKSSLSSPQSESIATANTAISRKYSYNLQNDQNQSVRITITEQYSSPSQKSIVKMVRISPNRSENLLETLDTITKVNECNGYNNSNHSAPTKARVSDIHKTTEC